MTRWFGVEEKKKSEETRALAPGTALKLCVRARL
jgi:hypothetical protein